MALTRNPETTRAWQQRSRRPLNRRSDRKKHFDAEFDAMRALVRQRSEGRCEARVSLNCRGIGEHVHHRGGRRRKDANDLDLLLHTCWRCHDWIHDHPVISRRLGFLVRWGHKPLPIIRDKEDI